MGEVFDVRHDGGDFVILGGALVLPTQANNVITLTDGSIRYNTTLKAIEYYHDSAWHIASGTTWREDSGVPSDSLGIDGDFYLDGATGDVYERISGTYTLECNIKGPTGPQGVTGPTGSQGVTGPTGPERSAVTMELQWTSGAIVSNDTVWFVYSPPYGGTINSLTYFVGTGSYSVDVKIAGSDVTGLTSISVDSATPATANATAANTFSAGQAITAVITGATGSPTDSILSLNVTWS
jgi:hypothetical protein